MLIYYMLFMLLLDVKYALWTVYLFITLYAHEAFTFSKWLKFHTSGSNIVYMFMC